MEIILYQSNQLKPQITMSPALNPAASIMDTPVIVLPTSLPIPKPTVKININLINSLRNLIFGLVIGAIILVLYTVWPILGQEISYRLSKPKNIQTTVSEPYPVMFEIADSQKQKLIMEEAVKYGVDTNFSIVIPKINATAKVISNVNPANEVEYENQLKKGVAHALNTKFPGEKGTIYLFSHSTNTPLNIARYNAVFYLLKELVPGDEIIIYYINRKYTYKVVDKVIAEANDTQWINSNSSEEQLILQTCWPPGTSTKRLIIIAKPI